MLTTIEGENALYKGVTFGLLNESAGPYNSPCNTGECFYWLQMLFWQLKVFYITVQMLLGHICAVCCLSWLWLFNNLHALSHR